MSWGSEWLGEQWVGATAAAAAGVVPERMSGTVEVTVKGAPPGEVRYHRVFDAGRVVGGGVGPAPAADVSVTVSAADARAMLAGRLDPSVAFMSGRLKTAGDNGRVLLLLAGWSTAEGRAARRSMAEEAGLA